MCLYSGTDERNEDEKKAEETELFTKYYSEWKAGSNRDSSYKKIPRFYYRVTLANIYFMLHHIYAKLCV